MESSRPYKICSHAGCNKLSRDNYCDEHKETQREKELQRYKDYNRYSRDNGLHSFYNSKEWKRVRLVVLAHYHNLCKHCMSNSKMTKADVVDHIVPIEIDYSKRLELSNLQPLCHACHNKKTAEDRRKYRDYYEKKGE